MDDFKPELLKALLDWVNTFDLPGRITSWNQLEDGQILWQILADIDPDYFNEPLPSFDETNRRASDNWIPRWQNLKHIERAVSTYIRENCEQLPVLTKRMIPDLKTGARDGSPMLVAKLTMEVLLAAVFSPKSNQRMIGVMGQLGTKTAETIAEAIQEMQALDARMAALGVDQELTPEPTVSGLRTPSRAVSMERDAGLEQEAQLFEANKERNQLKSQVARLRTDLQQSQDRISTLEEQLVEARLHLDVRGGEKKSSDENEELRAEIARERQYISELELDLTATKDKLSQAERQLERLKADDATKQDLRDQLQLVKAERDELNQKAKANENLKKKIQAMSQEMKTVENLRQEHQLYRERIQELEPLEDRVVALEKANKENAQTIVACETSIFEEKGKRTRVQHDNDVLTKQLQQARDLQAKAEEAQKELEERLRDLEAGNQSAGNTLEDELGDDQSEMISDGAKTPTEAQVTSETILLKQKLEILEARLKSLEAECLQLLTENLGLKSDSLEENDEQTKRPFLEQNQKLQATETELQEFQRKLREKEVENAELRNELNKKSDGSVEAQSEVQAQNDRLVARNKEIMMALQELELQHDEKTSLLKAALLNRDNLPPGLLELRRAETLKRVRAHIERAAAAGDDEKTKVVEDATTAITEEIVESQAAVEMAKKDLLEQQTLNETLKEEVERAKVEDGNKGSEELQKENENLRRELRLMTTAWYDMTCRLQSNTVVLQRRDSPKSWLGRQRAVVGGNGAPLRR